MGRSHIATWVEDDSYYPYGVVRGRIEWYYQRYDSGYYYYDFGPSDTTSFPGYNVWDNGYRNDLAYHKHYFDSDFSTMYSYPTDHDPTGTDRTGEIGVYLSKNPSLSYSFNIQGSNLDDHSSPYQMKWKQDFTWSGGKYTEDFEPATRYRIYAGDSGIAAHTYAQTRWRDWCYCNTQWGTVGTYFRHG